MAEGGSRRPVWPAVDSFGGGSGPRGARARPEACACSTRHAEEEDPPHTPQGGRRAGGRGQGAGRSAGPGVRGSWLPLLLLAAGLMSAAQGQISLFEVQGQFRGGAIAWEPVEPGSNTVRFTVTTAWLRSAGTYVKVVDGVPRPERGYQPVKGDVVNVMGFETPKFVTHNTEEYLQVRVTSSTEQVGNRSDIGQGKPHTNSIQSSSNMYWANNWFEGVAEYLVTLPSREVTYIAELHGCCRQSDMCRGDRACQLALDTGNSQNFRDGVGIKQFFNTPFHLSATVRLDRDPPPLSFLPHFVPFVIVDNGLPQDLELAVLDYMTVRSSAVQRLIPQSEEAWPDLVIRQQHEAAGTLSETRSRPTTGRRLQNFDFQQGNLTNLNAYPPQYVPAPVAVDAGVTGTDVRQVSSPSTHVRLYRLGGCTGADVAEVPPNTDVCKGSSAQQAYASGGRVQGNFTSFMVPAGMVVSISDQCEFTDPPRSYAGGFSWGRVLGSCDNREGTGPICCSLPSAENATMVRAMMKPPAVPLVLAPLRNDWIKVSYKTLPDQRVQANMRAVEVTVLNEAGNPVRRSMEDGNYVIRLKLATANSSSTTVEFILHLMTATSMVPQFARMVPKFPVTTAPVLMPSGFRSDLEWSLTPNTFELSDKTFFDNNSPQLFGPRPPVPPLTDVPPAPPAGRQTSAPEFKFAWYPCTESIGMYFYCVYGLANISPYTWSTTKCTFLRVVQDLPPKITIFDTAMPTVDKDSYSLYMGQSISAVVRAVDNPKDTIDLLSVSSVDVVTGDRLRAKVEYVYDKAPTAGQQVAGLPGTETARLLGWPRLVEPMLPVYLKLLVSAPAVNNTLGLPASQNKNIVERNVVFRPNRMHSGLVLSVCFLAVDVRGVCKTVGSATTRCMHISVERCRFAMSAGHSLLDVAGMFETNWLQLFALNPTHSSPDVPVTNATIVNVGHLYKMEEGDTVHGVMTKFGMDLQHIRLLNPDLSRNREAEWSTSLIAGYSICVIPDSCGTDV